MDTYVAHSYKQRGKFVFNLRAIATPDEESCSKAMEVDGIRLKKIMLGF